MKISLRVRYLVFIVVLHAVLAFLTYQWLREEKVLFIASEVLLLLSVAFSVQIYRDFQKPIAFVQAGIETIKNQDFTVKFVPTGKPEIDVLIEVYNLMIDQLRQERTQQMEQHFFLEKLIEASPIAILVLDFDERITTVNERTCALFQRPRGYFEGKTVPELDLKMLSQLEDLRDGEARSIKHNGIETYKVRRSHFMDRGFRRSFLMIEELTQELLETEKNAYGKVIRMMAHEVNNTLGATDSILQTASTLLSTPDYADLRDALLVASERNQRLTRFMRNFADVVRLPAPRQVPLDLHKLLREVALFMQAMAQQRGVVLQTALPEGTWVVAVDAGQLEQVLVNVIKNAIEACAPGQEVWVGTRAGSIQVRNNGQPIPAEVEAQLFNPFFGTKPDGQGVGLTLTRDILLNHGFPFSLRTQPDGWTAFEIRVE